MSKLTKFKFEVDLSNSTQFNALTNLLAAIGGQESEEIPLKEEPKPKKATSKPKKKAEAKEHGEAAVKEKPAEKETDNSASENENKIELPDVREKLGSVISGGGIETRDKCAAKLKDLGAKNVSTLDPEHYADFMDFLSSL